jgi:rod shape-determining protein MreD
MEALWQRLDLWLRAATPSASALFMALIGISAWPVPYLGSVMPPLAFIALFYWSAHRPDLFSPSIAFSIGLLNDLINSTPLGLSAFLFTVAHQIIWRQRGIFAGHSFFMLWAGFALAASAMMLAQWILLGVVNWQITPFLPALTQTVLAIIIFPLPCWILIQIQRNIVSPS